MGAADGCGSWESFQQPEKEEHEDTKDMKNDRPRQLIKEFSLVRKEVHGG